MARKKLPFLVIAALMGASAVYFVAYVEPRSDDLVELDFRRLAAMAERIDMQLATYRQVVANATRPPYFLPRPLELKGQQLQSHVASEPAREPVVAISEQITPGGRWFLFKTDHLEALLRVEDLVRQAFEPSAFDKLILATSDGRILHQEGRSDVHLTALDGLGIQDKSISQISRSTGLYNVEISGRSYKVFVQPCSIPRAVTPAAEGTPEGWVLFALMGTPQFHLRSLQVSANWLILIFGVALLALLALPFLKLLTIGKGARLRAIDGLLAGLCALIGLSVLTVLLLDAFVYKKLERAEARQTEKLAKWIRGSLRLELYRALDDFSALRRKALPYLRKGYPSSQPPDELARHNLFFWADESGQQIFKWTHTGKASPRIPVGDRAYFRDALAGRHSLGRSRDPEISGYTLESIRSWTTGEDELAIATREPGGAAVVGVLTTRLSSVHGAVLPPGFGFAVIDSEGNVLFHSDRRKMLQENFLEEADRQRLTALAATERAGAEMIPYMGRKHKVFLAPLPELSWSVIAFRDMTLLRATNVQIVTTALICLVLYAALFLALFSVVYMASSTRARWLWPVASRQGAYLQLSIFYAGCLFVYSKLLSDGNPIFLLVNGMLIPLLVLFVSYVKVRAGEGFFDRKQVGALVGILTLLLLSSIAGSPGIDLASRRFAVLSMVVGGMFLFLPRFGKLFSQRGPAPLRSTYLCTATLLLMVLTILPAASFFKLACDVPLENMLKLGQLTLMRELESPRALVRNYGRVFFGTRQFLSKEQEAEQVHEAAVAPHIPWLLEWQESVFPIYSEYSRLLARLSLDTPEGGDWRWEHWNGVLGLHRKAGPERPSLRLLSSFPSIKPMGLDWLGLGAGVLALGLVSFGLVWLMAHNLMLLGASLPLWLDRRKLSLGTSVTHLVYVSCQPERLRTPSRGYIETIDLAAAEAEVESGRILKRPVLATKRLVVVKGFEHRLEDPGFNWAKLRLLEALVGSGARRILLLSSQDPYLCLAAGLLVNKGDEQEREQDEHERWRRLLARFAVVDLDGRPKDAKRLAEKLQKTRNRLLPAAGRLRLSPWSLHVDGCLRVVREECSPTSYLQEIGTELLPDIHFDETSRGEIFNEILVRAEGYYAHLWGSLPEDEKLVLVQLAEEGLTNPRNLRPLQRLIARGLVRRDSAPRLMNETFRVFVFAAAAKEGVHQIEAQREQESIWGQLKVPLTAALFGGVFFFGFTQQEMLKTTLSFITVVAGTMPHLLQLVGYLGATKVPLPPVR